MKRYATKTSILAGSYILLMVLFFSCAFPFQSAENVELSDIGRQLNYHEI
jgi:hypothetical protein